MGLFLYMWIGNLFGLGSWAWSGKNPDIVSGIASYHSFLSFRNNIFTGRPGRQFHWVLREESEMWDCEKCTWRCRPIAPGGWLHSTFQVKAFQLIVKPSPAPHSSYLCGLALVVCGFWCGLGLALTAPPVCRNLFKGEWKLSCCGEIGKSGSLPCLFVWSKFCLSAPHVRLPAPLFVCLLHVMWIFNNLTKLGFSWHHLLSILQLITCIALETLVLSIVHYLASLP